MGGQNEILPLGTFSTRPPNSCATALAPSGWFGAFGAFGVLGPVGNNAWNPSMLITGIGEWSALSRRLTDMGGPMSDLGILGHDDIQTSFAVCERNGEPDLLGPMGPAGPRGLLGPLGPLGGHGYVANRNGEFTSGGETIRAIDVERGGRYSQNLLRLMLRASGVSGTTSADIERRYELFEHYREEFAKSMPNNDTSFMVSGSTALGARDSYSFMSDTDQWVSVVVVPVNALSDFDFDVASSQGHVLHASSPGRQKIHCPFCPPINTPGEIDARMFRAQAGQSYVVNVSAKHIGLGMTRYRLIVTGAGTTHDPRQPQRDGRAPDPGERRAAEMGIDIMRQHGLLP